MNNKFLCILGALGVGLMIWHTADLTYRYHKLRAIGEVQNVVLEETLKRLEEDDKKKQKKGS